MTELRAQVFCSWGLWVADCPRPYCRNAEHYGHAPVTGHVGGLTREGFRCNRCELVCASQWPANAQDIWALLTQRPVMETRNWSIGETLEDLMIENVQHGVTPVEALTAGAVIVEDRLTPQGLALASAQALPAIGA